MKKLMIAAAIVCAAIASQASAVNWQTSIAPYFFDTASINGNGPYDAGTSKMKATGRTFAYTLAVTGIGEATGNVAMNFASKIATNGIELDGTIAAGTVYDYVITITTSLSDLGKSGEWDYSKAVATTTLSGTFTGATGTSTLSSGVPTTWSVSGAEGVPEPTSAMLLLLGVAGLALKRKQK